MGRTVRSAARASTRRGTGLGRSPLMSAGSQLSYDVLISGLLPASAEPLPNGDRPHWSPLSHTLIYGATEATIGRMIKATPDGVPAGSWAALFPGQLPPIPITIAAQPAPANGFTIDGHPLVPVEAGHSDTDDSTVLHAPSIGLVAAGDVVYNNVHQYLAETGAVGLAGWYQALDIVGSLQPTHV